MEELPVANSEPSHLSSILLRSGMPSRVFWDNWSDDKLMAMPLKHFGLTIENTPVQEGINILKADYEMRALKLFPFFWISTEWFCPDGVNGIAIPFYLLHPRLLRMEMEIVGVTEGANIKECTKILRHEAGHAFENCFATRSNPLRVQTFGDSFRQDYPTHYQARLYSRAYVKNLGQGYAQCHPDEDFAETFAVWLGENRTQWRKKYFGTKAIKKLEVVDYLVKLNSKKRNIFKTSTRTTENINQSNMTLREYYRNKRSQLRLLHPQKIQRKIESYFKLDGHQVDSLGASKGRSSQKKIYEFLSKNRDDLASNVASAIGVPKYKVVELIRDWQMMSKIANLDCAGTQTQLFQQALDGLVLEYLERLYFSKDRYFI